VPCRTDGGAILTDRQAYRLAEKFWSLVDHPEPFPRALESPILWALPLAIIMVPRLGLSEAQRWLTQRGISISLTSPDRRVRACLIARAGAGIVFLDGQDPEDERRFSLAHETAHFLLDYLWPRQHALASLGGNIREVLDGRRPPTPQERLGSLFKGAVLGTYTHFMDRTEDGGTVSSAVLRAEDDADRLALELLAPKAVVVQTVTSAISSWRSPESRASTVKVLLDVFGLPADVAQSYAGHIVDGRRGNLSFAEWLGR